MHRFAYCLLRKRESDLFIMSNDNDNDFISFPLKWVLKTNYNQYIKKN